MKNHLKEYKGKLEKSIGEYMEMPASERSSAVVKNMVDCWEKIGDIEKHLYGEKEFTPEDARKWNEKMLNADGSSGGHWTVAQTNDVGKSVGLDFAKISEPLWNAAMNMIFSDYAEVAEKFGVGTPEFYADMAKAFLWDKDGGSPSHKMAAYYDCIVDRD